MRKSKKTGQDDESRINVLKRMSNKLQQRSLVQKVFASVSANANDALLKRDLVKNDILEKLEIDGDMQDTLTYISCTKNVVLVTLDYAALTTDPNDLLLFLQNNLSISTVIVDNFPHTNDINNYSAKDPINNPNRRKLFDCRKGTYQLL
ncbi:hypothetical protein DFQ28_009242 [Apophysomyces sp. BC1034]|nr:hypothetical protein DFQ30_008977 [Apophysomyces sp. BC1015]KAG0175345.1 hypothetical protein DFQ29_007165 [Apophysomyces sp. BC1021]KAG0192418.1 hypothetical protein DFQ28_009242 [Apophysomyces sp. BC1034]